MRIVANQGILGFDIGGSFVRFALWRNKQICCSGKVKNPATKQQLTKLLRRIYLNLDKVIKIKFIGLGVAGVVNDSILLFSPNLPRLNKLNFQTIFAGCPVKIGVDNDARCFARAEMAKHRVARSKNTLFLTLGTGVGRAWCRDGRIVKVKRFEYPEPWEIAYKKLRSGGANQYLASWLAQRLASIIRQYQPRHLVLGGGLILTAGPVFLKKFKKELLAVDKTMHISKSKLGDNAGVLGAAQLFDQK